MITKNKLILLLLFCTTNLFAEEYLDFHQIVRPQVANNKTITLEKDAKYLLDIKNVGSFYILNLKNLVIDGNGSTIICNKQQLAFFLRDCENVTLTNFKIEYDPPCSTQGTITKITNDRTFEVQIHDGYPIPDRSIKQDRIEIYDKENKELIRNYHTTYATTNLAIDEVNRKVSFTIANPKAGVYSEGDFITLNNVPEGLPPHCFELSGCKNTKFDNITIYDSPHFSILEYDCDNSHYFRCTIDRKTNVPGREDRLRSGMADGINSNGALKGPKIEECIIRYNGDDCIAISGTLYPVYKSNQARKRIYFLTNGVNSTNVNFKVGDEVICMANDGSVRKRAKVTDVADAPSAPTEEERKACFAKLPNILNSSTFTTGVSIQIDEWIDGSDSGDLIYSNDRIGNGFEIINSEIGHNRSRGLLIKSGEGKIMNNHVWGSAMSGLALCPEIYWMGAGLAYNVEISNNTIENCMFDATMRDTHQSAAFVVMSEAPCGGYAPASAMDNIRIHRNQIIGCPNPSVVITSVGTGYFYQNTINPDLSMIRQHGADHGIDNSLDYQEINVGIIHKDQDPTGIDSHFDTAAANSFYVDQNNNLCLSGNLNDDLIMLSIHSIDGKQLSSESYNQESFPLSLNHLQSGLYVIRITCNNKTECIKYIAK